MALRAALLAASLLAAASVPAADVTAGDLLVRDAWARPTPPGITVGAVYLSIVNRGAAEDRLVGVASPLAAQGEIHETSSQGGMMSMRPIVSLACPAHATVRVTPGGVHIMLVGLKQPWTSGTAVPLTLTFQRAGSVTLNVPVESRE